jgi:type II secretion system protein C
MNEKRFIRVLTLTKAALVVVLAYAGFRAITGRLQVRAFDPGTVSGHERPPDTQSTPTETRSPSDYSAIVQGNLFSTPEAAASTSPGRLQTTDSLPSAEELGLRLTGTIAGGPALSRATIQDTKNNTTGVYRIGDTVASATIESIQRDAVVLNHEGRHLVLRPRSGAGNDKAPSENKDPPVEEKAAPASRGSALPFIQADYAAELFRQATIQPYVKNNRTEGLRITGLDKIPMAEAVGLKDGDVIQTINGQQLTSKQKAFQVLMKARTQSKVDIQLLRNGKSKNLSFDR